MRTIISFIIFILFTACSNSKSPELIAKEKEAFLKEHNNFLRDIRKQSDYILSDKFNFDGIEVVYVQSGELYYQWFGHVFIRFVGSGENFSEDLGVSFIADFNDFNLDNLKAYYGGYTVLPVVDRWKNYVRDYTVKEKRYMDRYIIPMSKSEQEKVKQGLKSWIKDPSLPGTYSFRRNSCTALLLKLLALSNNGIKEPIAFPIEVITYLKEIEKVGHSYTRITPDNYQDVMLKVVDKKNYLK
ncbi:MAG: hypothetical protein CME69_02670 [Halobacteriovorax sp.]|nr:hypothetical protein [Halobacteriovorax sp.]